MRKIITCIYLTFLLVFVFTARAMDLVAVTATSSRISDVAIAGDYAYCSDDFGLLILDLAEPQTPEVVSRWGSPGLSRGVTFLSPYAYLGDGDGGLHVIDCSNPQDPSGTATLTEAEEIVNVINDGERLYAAAGGAGVLIYSLLEPGNPFLLGEYDTEGWVRSVSVWANWIALADEMEGVLILDGSDPGNPNLLSTISLLGTAQDVILLDEMLISLDREYGVSLWDISDPQNPRRMSTLTTGGFSTDILSDGEYLFVADWFSGVTIYSIADPYNLEWIASLSPSGFPEAMTLQDSILALAVGDDGVQLWNIAEPSAPVYVADYRSIGSSQDAVITPEGLVFEAAGDEGLRVWDSALSSSEPIAQVDTPGWATALGITNDWICLADGFQGIRIFSRGSDPQETALLPSDGYVGSIFVDGSENIYAAQGEDGIVGFTLDAAGQPQVYGTVATDHYVYDLSSNGESLISCEGIFGFGVFDVTDPASPLQVSQFLPQGGAWCAAQSGDFAYIGTGVAGIEVFDLSDPYLPLSLGTIEGLGWVENLEIGGATCLIAACGENGVFALDISEPIPGIYDEFNTYGFARNAGMLGLELVVADQWDLSLLGTAAAVNGRKNVTPYRLDVSGPYPNPFNPATTIAFALPSSSPVEVTVYDPAGRRVQTLLKDNLNAGDHRLEWKPASGVSSGIYLVVIKIGAVRQTLPVVYLK